MIVKFILFLQLIMTDEEAVPLIPLSDNDDAGEGSNQTNTIKS